MANDSISLWVAFAGGVVSFISPCVLPIIPGFLAYLSGATLGNSQAKRLELFLNSLFFVIGFSIVFAALGVLLNTLLRGVAYDVQAWLAWIGGAIIIFFGLYLMEFFHIPFLEREHKLGTAKKFNSRYLTSLVFGMAFAAGWTPCVGVALAAILGLAVSAPGTAFYLLLAYSLGLGLPFLIVGLFASQAANLINKYSGVVRYVNIAFGAILVVLGVLVFTQNLSYIANWSLLNNVLIGK
jgi:cytochrome c-type biogenesis protein